MFKFFFQTWNPFYGYRFPYNLYKWPTPLWGMIKDLFHWIRYGYPRCFTWSVDVSVAIFVIPLLKHLRDHSHGCPCDFLPDGGRREYTDEEFAKSHEEWKKALTKMIKAFENVESLAAETAFGELYKKDRELAIQTKDAIEKETDEGLFLFAKYYRNLWD